MAIDYAEPEGGMAFISVNDQDKRAVAFIARELVRLGFSLLATRGHLGRAARLRRALRGDRQDPRGEKLGGGRHCRRGDRAA